MEPVEGKNLDEAPPRKSKVLELTKTVMGLIFCDYQRILLNDFKERDTMFNEEYYARLLHKLNIKIKRKRS